jgi:hypothetical protein
MNCHEANAIDLLCEDHRQIERLLLRLTETRQPTSRIRLLRQLSDELVVHLLVEEGVFLPACGLMLDRGRAREIYEEHLEIRVRLGELRAVRPDSEQFSTQLMLLAVLVHQHVQAQERVAAGLFPRVRRSEIDLAATGREVAVRRMELLGEASAGTLAGPQAVAA